MSLNIHIYLLFLNISIKKDYDFESEQLPHSRTMSVPSDSYLNIKIIETHFRDCGIELKKLNLRKHQAIANKYISVIVYHSLRNFFKRCSTRPVLRTMASDARDWPRFNDPWTP